MLTMKKMTDEEKKQAAIEFSAIYRQENEIVKSNKILSASLESLANK